MVQGPHTREWRHYGDDSDPMSSLSYGPRLWVMNSRLHWLELHCRSLEGFGFKIDGKGVEQEGDLYMFKSF